MLHSISVKNRISLFVAVLIVLSGYAIYASTDALQRGERLAAFVMLVIAAIFLQRVQKSS